MNYHHFENVTKMSLKKDINIFKNEKLINANQNVSILIIISHDLKQITLDAIAVVTVI